MKRLIIILVCIFVGCLIGVVLPFKPIAFGCEIPLFSSWEVFMDWTLRLIEALGVVGAIAVALFKEDIVRLIKHPKLVTDIDSNFKSDDIPKGQNVEALRYYKTITVENIGNATAEDCQVVIDSITYKAQRTLTDVEMLNAPHNIVWLNTGTSKEDISVTCKRSFDLFQILSQVREDDEKSMPEIPMSLIIGGVEMKKDNIGGEYIVTLKIESDNMIPKVLKVKIEWTGEWRNQRAEMAKVLIVSELKR